VTATSGSQNLGGGALSEFGTVERSSRPPDTTSAAPITNQSLAIDSSGNVWASAYDGFGYGNGCCTGGGFTETVGVAAPTIDPISVATKNNAIGTRP
jgi:hypothetical protein